MHYRSCFDIIGPIMVGPSSSHTAGAVLIGKFAHHFLGSTPQKVGIIFYDSFAATYQGHGTDRAIVGGLLGLDIADERIKESLELAEVQKMQISIDLEEHCPYYDHPNTTLLVAESMGRCVRVGGVSLGGGLSKIFMVNGLLVDIDLNSATDFAFLSQQAGSNQATTI